MAVVFTAVSLALVSVACLAFLASYAWKYGKAWDVGDPVWRFVVLVNGGLAIAAPLAIVQLLGVTARYPWVQWARGTATLLLALGLIYQLVVLYLEDSD